MATLRNRAGIYFDYNEPVITNRVVTFLMPLLATEEGATVQMNAKLMPNPTEGAAVLSYSLAETTTISINLLDINGRVLRTIQHNTTNQAGTYNLNLETADLAVGMYLVQFKTDNGVQTYKLVRQ
jgi:hypothetical protein